MATLSFQISGASVSIPAPPRLDRYDSRKLIEQARNIYFTYLADSRSEIEPSGVVLHKCTGDGRVVFEHPVLLPDEHFLNLELLRGKIIRNRNSRVRNRVVN